MYFKGDRSDKQKRKLNSENLKLQTLFGSGVIKSHNISNKILLPNKLHTQLQIIIL